MESKINLKMSKKIRLDKFLSEMGIGTRSEVKSYIKKGRVTVDGKVFSKGEEKIDPVENSICFDRSPVVYHSYVYLMLNKPQGVITATQDKKEKTVLDLIPKARKDLFPVGRLDKDTEGLLLITNDGELAHQLLSPKKHVAKTYYAKIDGRAGEEQVKAFLEGVFIEKDLKTQPAQLKVLSSSAVSEIQLTIYEGKFHQVKRMFETQGMKVLYLKRLSMGSLFLDNRLLPGEYRELTKEEIKELFALCSTVVKKA